MSGGRFAIFLINVLCIWALMHAYVFWRISSVPWVLAHFSRWTVWLVALALYLSYPAARLLQSWHLGAPAMALEFIASTWTGVLFLLFCAFLVVDVFTAGGLLAGRHAPVIRTGALVTALALCIPALIQGYRAPVISEHEVRLRNLPKALDGLSLVVVSDLHLGYLVGNSWLDRLVSRVNQLQPDILVAAGDVIDGNVDRVRHMTPTLNRFEARLGKYAVTGNHEYYAGVDESVRLLEAAGFRVLRDASTKPVEGLTVSGVDDLTARLQMKLTSPDLQHLLADSDPGASGREAPDPRESNAQIFLCHSPANVQQAAGAGADLMLSGHTHNGQIWPFTYLVKTRYPFVSGRYQVDEMVLLVSRGAGTWGPRMRLWQPGEILRITLRSPASVS